MHNFFMGYSFFLDLPLIGGVAVDVDDRMCELLLALGADVTVCPGTLRMMVLTREPWTRAMLRMNVL